MINLSTSAFYERAARQMGELRGSATKLQQQIGTGERLTKSSDDPVAAARLRTLSRSETISGIDQRNSDGATSDLKLTDGALESVANLIARVKELSVQAGNGTLSTSQRAAIGKEIEALGESLLTLANSRNAEGQALFGGQATGQAYSVTGGVVSYDGTATVDPVDLGEGQSVQPALTGPEVFDFTGPGGATNLFKTFGDLAAALQGGVADPAQAARDALGVLDAGLDKLTTAQTVVGARMVWVDMLDERRIAQSELVADEQASVGGADLASTMTRLQEMMTILEASQASFVKLSNLSLFNQLR